MSKIWVDPAQIGLRMSGHPSARPIVLVGADGMMRRSNRLELVDRSGQVVAQVVYSPTRGPSLKTRVWIEVDDETLEVRNASPSYR